MKNLISKISVVLILSAFIHAYGYAQPKYEFRGVWVATVDNIDWPSNKFLGTDSQKLEFKHLLDLHFHNGMNAIIAQIRPSTDAFYPSQYEPWSEWLTGIQGAPPIPYYDPLEFMIEETHKRGMEFHAWMNPYRAEFKLGVSSISATHITRVHPEWFLNYGDKKYFDPGNKAAQQFVGNIVRDVVNRYAIDAIHFDDYFYPYRIAGKEFPDSVSFSLYGKGMQKDNWRRSNVDSIISLLAKIIKKENKYCKFGISPFGVWRNIDKDPEGSNTKAGQTNYDDLYADILLWLKLKWIDYVAPQLYWEFSQKVVGFGTLIDWWAKHSYGRQLYIGQGIYRALESKSVAWKNVNELPNQIKKIREYSQVQGSIFFSSKSFQYNPNGWNDSLKNNLYKYPAIVPPMPWIDSSKPPLPNINKLNADDSVLDVELSGNKKGIKEYVLYLSDKRENLTKNLPYEILPATVNLIYHIKKTFSSRRTLYFAISSISNTNNESPNPPVYSMTFTENAANHWLIQKIN